MKLELNRDFQDARNIVGGAMAYYGLKNESTPAPKPELSPEQINRINVNMGFYRNLAECVANLSNQNVAKSTETLPETAANHAKTYSEVIMDGQVIPDQALAPGDVAEHWARIAKDLAESSQADFGLAA